MPVLFALMFLGVQAGLYFHARSVAIAAAQEGARDAGARGGTQAMGVGTARDFIAQAGGRDVLRAVSVTSRRTAVSSTVTVHGRAMSVVPGWKVLITQSASAPVERLTDE